jgi:cytochrome c-type biogenesis protein CcmH
MIGLWVTIAAVTAMVMTLVLFPLFRRRGSATPPDRVAYDLAVYQDQLAEIDRDIERGLLQPDRAEAARLEIKRRMLSSGAAAQMLSNGTAAAGAESPAHQTGRSPVLAAVLAIAVPLVALGVYWDLGHPGGPKTPVAARDAEAPQMTMEQAVAQLQQRLDEDPANLEGWLLLGRSYLSLGRPAEAAVAYRTAAGLSDQRPDIVADYGEALVAADQGRVSPLAQSLFERALSGDRKDTKARYYIALAKAQRGDLEGALQDWTDVMALSPPDAPWVPAVREQMARAATELGVDPQSVTASAEVRSLGGSASKIASNPPGPTEEDVAVAAQMSAEERAAMINAMVDRLAARLEDDPDNIEGWLRLAGAYEMIGQSDKAREARARAEALRGR